MIPTPSFSKEHTPRIFKASSTMYNGGMSTNCRISLNSSAEAQGIKHAIKNVVNSNKMKRYIFKRSKEEKMHASDFKKILPGNPDVHGILFDETDSDDQFDDDTIDRSLTPERLGNDTLHTTEGSPMQLISIEDGA